MGPMAYSVISNAQCVDLFPKVDILPIQSMWRPCRTKLKRLVSIGIVLSLVLGSPPESPVGAQFPLECVIQSRESL
jgi:hypothetical protein